MVVKIILAIICGAIGYLVAVGLGLERNWDLVVGLVVGVLVFVYGL